MKKHSRIISILLAIMMILTSFSIVFAVDELTEEPQSDDQAVVTEETAPADETAPVDETVPADETDSAEETVPADETAPVDETDSDKLPEPDGEFIYEEQNAGRSSIVDDLVRGLERPNVTVIINYVYDTGKKAANSVTLEIELTANSKGVYEGKYSVKSPEIKGYAPSKKVVEGTVNGKSKDPTTITVTYKPAPTDPVKNFKTHPTFDGIILTWDRVEDAKSYVIQRSIDKKTYTDLATVKNPASGKEIKYTDGTANGRTGSFSLARTYYYRVLSVSVTDIRSDKPAEAADTCVRKMYEKVRFIETKTLTSHDRYGRSHTFRTGDVIVAQGFNGGTYEFMYNGYYYTVSYVRVAPVSADYQPNSVANGRWDSYSGIWGRQNYASAEGVGDNYQGIRFYDKISAESFVNRSGQGSRTGYLIWVSTYTQHLYIFQGRRGNWKLIKDWECSTGATKSPTPTGFNKEIFAHESHDGRIPYWCNFQTANSIHGHRSSYTFGSPQSNGCVRNYSQNAKWVYYNCGKGTGVIIY